MQTIRELSWEGHEARFLSSGTLSEFITGRRFSPARNVGSYGQVPDPEVEDAEAVLSFRRLQDIPDYRRALQTWMKQLSFGGLLIVVVPHAFLYERRLSLPSPWRSQQQRLYTPASLLSEIEEALVPNSYRIRWLGDADAEYDYGSPPDVPPSGQSDVIAVIERIVSPSWSLVREPVLRNGRSATAPSFAFEPPRTRIERDGRPDIKRILLLKLDHLGDLIMGLPALERVRRYFPDATIDLVVGSWNEAMARDLGLADRVIAFDAFPRNSTEEEPNVDATIGQFRALVTDHYDLGIDLRADGDTRVLLRAAKASLKAGIGTKARYPYLDIALPLDNMRNEAERAREDHFKPGDFSSQEGTRRTHFRIHSDSAKVEQHRAIVWGPYVELEPGDYIFDFLMDIEDGHDEGLIRLDVALRGGNVACERFVSGPAIFQLPFRVDTPRTRFEARIHTVEGHPSISFDFYGGNLIKRGPGNVLHQSEYASLLVELVKMRVHDFGLAQDLVLG